MPHDGLTIDQRFFPVPDELAGCLTAIVRIDVSTGSSEPIADHMQPEWASIRFSNAAVTQVSSANGDSLRGASAIATGASSAPTRYLTHDIRIWGVGFLPLGWARLMDSNAAAMANRAVDVRLEPTFSSFAPLADDLFAETVSDEREYGLILDHLRQIDRAQGEPGTSQKRNWEQVAKAQDALINPNISDVSEFAAEAGLTVRSLERLCAKVFGFPPAKLLRRQRLMRSLTQYMMSPGKNWGAVIDPGYHDQAHFVREFHAFMGMSPTEYAALDSPILDALMAERAKMLGAATQTLHPSEPRART